MAKRKNRKSKTGKKTGGSARAMVAAGRQMSPRAPGMTPQAMDYLRLLADPCHAKLVPAPYAGVGSSLVVRTTDYYNFTAATGATGSEPARFIAEITPWNYPSGITAGNVITGSISLVTPTDNFPSNFIQIPSVHSYRPIAACVKWIPTGPVAGRSGLIGMSYNPSKVTNAGDVAAVDQALSTCQSVASNGSVQHEMIWLPSFGDERFSKYDEVNINGAGSILLVGQDIDAKNGAPYGTVEITIVWEWVPSYGASVTSSSAAPSSTTLQQVLSSIKDISAFIRGGARAVSMGYTFLSRFGENKSNSFLLA